MDSFDQVAMQIWRAKLLEVKRRLIASIEEIEGRVPTNAEIAQESRHLQTVRHDICAHVECWIWRGVVLFEARHKFWGAEFEFCEPDNEFWEGLIWLGDK